MPYTIKNPPEAIKDMPMHAQEIFIAAFNSAWKEHPDDEATCNKIAWAAVKQSYQQDKDGNWIQKQAEGKEELKTVDIAGVEILAVGEWNGSAGKVKFTAKDLAAIAEAFDDLTADKNLNYEPPAKLGHDDKQQLLQADGYPAAGWVSQLKVKGEKLVASFRGVPKKLGDLIKAGAYKKVSSEVYTDYKLGGKTYPRVLKAVAFLGADIPAVKSIADMQALYNAEALLDEQGTPFQAVIFEESLDKQAGKIRDAYYAQFRNPAGIMPVEDTGYCQEVFAGHVIVNRGEQLFKIPYTLSGAGEPVFDAAQAVRVERVYQEIKATPETPETEQTEKEELMLKEAVKELGLAESASEQDVLSALKSLKAKADNPAQLSEMEGLKTTLKTLETKLSESEKRIALKERDERVRNAVNSGKVTPAQKAWADEYALKDPAGFDAFVSAAPVAVKTGEIGSSVEDPANVQLTEKELEVAKLMGVPQDALLKSKKEEVS